MEDTAPIPTLHVCELGMSENENLSIHYYQTFTHSLKDFFWFVLGNSSVWFAYSSIFTLTSTILLMTATCKYVYTHTHTGNYIN